MVPNFRAQGLINSCHNLGAAMCRRPKCERPRPDTERK